MFLSCVVATTHVIYKLITLEVDVINMELNHFVKSINFSYVNKHPM